LDHTISAGYTAVPNKTKENMTRLTDKIRGDIKILATILRIGTRCPSVVWHYAKDQFRYYLVERGVPPAAAKEVAAIRAEFEAHAAMGQFKETWFDVHIAPWCVTLSKIFDRKDPVRVLEIGSWEGRSTLFLLTYFTHGQVTAVDTWAGSDEYHYNATSELGDLEARFDGNVAPGVSRLSKRKGSSLHVLPQLLDEQQKFDVIYVDGSHFADDVLTDGINAWRLLEVGGVMIFDDFLWYWYPRARANPAWAVDSFLKYHVGEYKVLGVSYQFILQKTKTFADKPREYTWRSGAGEG
jgi:predicted O-methyltransferase YrrM